MNGLITDKQSVIGALKATNSKDRDVLHAKKEEMKSNAKPLVVVSWAVTVFGALLCITVIGAFMGIPMILLSWWGRSYVKKNLKMIETSFQEYVNEIELEKREV